MKTSLIAGLVTGLGVIAGGTGLWMTKTERIERLIERKFDCRCSIDSVSFKLLSSPIQVSFTGLKLFPKSEENQEPIASVPAGRLSVSGLFSGSPVLEEIFLNEPHFSLVVTEEGANWDIGKDKETKGEVAPGGGEGGGAKTKRPNDGLKSLRKIQVANGRIDYHNAKNDLFASLTPFTVSSENASTGVFSLVGDVAVTNNKAGAPFISLSQEAKVTFATAEEQPDIAVEMIFGSGSQVTRDFPVFEKAWSVVDKLKDFGISVGKLPEQVMLKSDKTLLCQVDDDVLTVLSELPLTTRSGWGVMVKPGASFQMETTEHSLEMSIGADAERTDRLISGFNRFVDKLPGTARKVVERKVKPVLLRNGQLALDLTSQGKLSRPKVRTARPLPNVKDLLKNGVEGVLRGLFGSR